MTRTLAAKVMEGLHSQGFRVLGWGGTWAGAMRPLEEYVKRRVERAVKAEREACARVCEGGSFLHDDAPDAKFGKACAAAIRARETK